ncbi:DMT family transporter [Terrisporobacter sp.]
MRKELKADLYLFLMTIFIGISLPVTSIALKTMSPFVFISIRYLLASIVLAIPLYKSFKKLDKKTFIVGFIIGFTLFVGMGLQTIGLMYTTPSISGFIMGLTVVFVPILDAILYKKFPDIKTIIGIVLSLIGLIVMCGSFESGINIGEILTLIGSISIAAQIMIVDKFGKTVNVSLMTFIELFVAGLISLFTTIITGDISITLSPNPIICVIFVAVFATTLALFVMNKMQPDTNPTHAAIIYLMEPVSSALVSILIGYVLTTNTIIGCIIIIIGTLIISIK